MVVRTHFYVPGKYHQMSLVAKIICWFFALLFLTFAAVQFNDPDPMLWVVIYVAFALLSLSVVYFRMPGAVYLLAALMTAVWAWFQWPDVWEGIGESMLTENMERGREALGLLICTFAAVLMFFISRGKEDKVKQIDNFRS